MHSHTKENKQKIHKKNFFKDLNTLQKESKQLIITQTQSHRNSQLEKVKTQIFLDAFLHEQEKPLLISEQNKTKRSERTKHKQREREKVYTKINKGNQSSDKTRVFKSEEIRKVSYTCGTVK